jgi:RND family efflux transporter MFP subunit
MKPALTLTLALWLPLAASPSVALAAASLSVPTVTVGAGTASAALVFDAQLQPVHQATITSQVGGSVLALRVKAGDAVKRGAPLLRLDDRELRAGLARGDAAVTQAQAELRNAQQVFDRNRELRANGFISQAALDGADNQFKSSQAALLQAQAARAQAQVAQGYTELVAPFDGVVAATLVETGDLALPGRALLTLYEPGKLRAVVQLPSSQIAAATGAQAWQVQLPDGSALTPVTRELLPAADPVSQTVEWRLTLPEGTPNARPGQSVRVLVSGSAMAQPVMGRRLSLPAQAVLRRGELTAVYVAVGEGFVLRAVRLGEVMGPQVEVLAGLTAGERVALDPVRAGLRGAAAAR